MSYYFVAPAFDVSIELVLSDHVERAMALQMERLESKSAIEAFGQRIGRSMEALLLDMIDWDIKEPTPAQISFAMVLSKRLNISIPPDALRHRGAMHDFLERHAQKPKGHHVP